MAGTGQESLVPPDVAGGFSIKFATYQGRHFFRRTKVRVLLLLSFSSTRPVAHRRRHTQGRLRGRIEELLVLTRCDRAWIYGRH